MQQQYLTGRLLKRYQAYLCVEEKSEATIQKYLRDIRAFYTYLKGEPITGRETVIGYKQWLENRGYAVTSINSMLVAVNGLMTFLGRPGWRVHLLRQQRDAFGLRDRELTRQEYLRLVRTAAARGDERLALLLQTICATGIRVSELRYITVASLRSGQAQISCKGKVRRILIPQALCVRLRDYCRRRGIGGGSVFVTRSGAPMDRSNIWAVMKRLCRAAGVAEHKVFPHNLRHLFARTFYKQYKDIVHLADVLGHSSVNTTRIYTMVSAAEHRGQISRMHLLI